jgi:hypothetical protein
MWADQWTRFMDAFHLFRGLYRRSLEVLLHRGSPTTAAHFLLVCLRSVHAYERATIDELALQRFIERVSISP